MPGLPAQGTTILVNSLCLAFLVFHLKINSPIKDSSISHENPDFQLVLQNPKAHSTVPEFSRDRYDLNHKQSPSLPDHLCLSSVSLPYLIPVGISVCNL
jgi:hypothetical protein